MWILDLLCLVRVGKLMGLLPPVPLWFTGQPLKRIEGTGVPSLKNLTFNTYFHDCLASDIQIRSCQWNKTMDANVRVNILVKSCNYIKPKQSHRQEYINWKVQLTSRTFGLLLSYANEKKNRFKIQQSVHQLTNEHDVCVLKKRVRKDEEISQHTKPTMGWELESYDRVIVRQLKEPPTAYIPGASDCILLSISLWCWREVLDSSVACLSLMNNVKKRTER